MYKRPEGEPSSISLLMAQPIFSSCVFADLKAIFYLDLLGVEAALVDNGVHHGDGKAHEQGCVVFVVHLPAGGCAGGDDVDVAVDCGAGVGRACAAARDLFCRAYINGDEYAGQLGHAEDAGRIAAELHCDTFGGAALSEDARLGRLGGEASWRLE